jgi:hypothetical protein
MPGLCAADFVYFLVPPPYAGLLSDDLISDTGTGMDVARFNRRRGERSGNSGGLLTRLIRVRNFFSSNYRESLRFSSSLKLSSLLVLHSLPLFGTFFLCKSRRTKPP